MFSRHFITVASQLAVNFVTTCFPLVNRIQTPEAESVGSPKGYSRQDTEASGSAPGTEDRGTQGDKGQGIWKEGQILESYRTKDTRGRRGVYAETLLQTSGQMPRRDHGL